VTTEELALEVERLRGVLARIEALEWYEPDDEDDLVEAVRAMVRERDEARSEVERLRRQLASVGATTAPLYTSQERELLIQQRDEARAEVERLRSYWDVKESEAKGTDR